MATVYRINKGVNASFEFKGLKAQYITYLAIGLIVILVAFAICYMMELPLYITVPAVAGMVGVLVSRTYRMSRKYGEHGLAKLQAHKMAPSLITCHQRVFKIAGQPDNSNP